MHLLYFCTKKPSLCISCVISRLTSVLLHPGTGTARRGLHARADCAAAASERLRLRAALDVMHSARHQERARGALRGRLPPGRESYVYGRQAVHEREGMLRDHDRPIQRQLQLQSEHLSNLHAAVRFHGGPGGAVPDKVLMALRAMPVCCGRCGNVWSARDDVCTLHFKDHSRHEII